MSEELVAKQKEAEKGLEELMIRLPQLIRDTRTQLPIICLMAVLGFTLKKSNQENYFKIKFNLEELLKDLDKCQSELKDILEREYKTESEKAGAPDASNA